MKIPLFDIYTALHFNIMCSTQLPVNQLNNEEYQHI